MLFTKFTQEQFNTLSTTFDAAAEVKAIEFATQLMRDLRDYLAVRITNDDIDLLAATYSEMTRDDS